MAYYYQGGRGEDEVEVICLSPCVCKTPMGKSTPPVPYIISAKQSDDYNLAKECRFNGKQAFTMDSRITKCTGNEAGTAGGVKSGVNTGWCRPKTHTNMCRIEGAYVVCDGDQFDMNLNGPNGASNTIGEVHHPAMQKPMPEFEIRVASSDLKTSIEIAKEVIEASQSSGGGVNPSNIDMEQMADFLGIIEDKNEMSEWLEPSPSSKYKKLKRILKALDIIEDIEEAHMDEDVLEAKDEQRPLPDQGDVTHLTSELSRVWGGSVPEAFVQNAIVTGVMAEFLFFDESFSEFDINKHILMLDHNYKESNIPQPYRDRLAEITEKHDNGNEEEKQEAEEELKTLIRSMYADESQNTRIEKRLVEPACFKPSEDAKKHQDEYEDHLTNDQNKTLNELSNEEYLKRRNEYLNTERNDGALRQSYRTKFAENMKNQNMGQDMDLDDAVSFTEDYMRGRDAAHHLDAVAGGLTQGPLDDVFVGMVTSVVNQHIGSMWPSRVAELDQHALEQYNAGKGQEKMNAKLRVCEEGEQPKLMPIKDRNRLKDTVSQMQFP